MEIIEGSALAELLLEKYARNPKGWSFLAAPSRASGFFDAIVSNETQAWQIKMDSVFKPAPLMLGAQTEVDHVKIGSLSPMNFGYRELNPGLLLRALKNSHDHGRDESAGRTFGLDIASILKSEPIVPRLGGSYAQGPFVFSHENVVKLSGGAESVDERLSSEMLQLFRRRYPSYR